MAITSAKVRQKPRGAWRRARRGRLNGRPGTDDLEEHRHASMGGRLDAQRLIRRLWQRALPRRALGRIRARNPCRFDRLKTSHVESRGSKERGPGGWLRGGRGIFAPRRHCRELREQPAIVEGRLSHARHDRRRIPGRGPLGRAVWHERCGARSIPEEHDRRDPFVELIPAIGGVVRVGDLIDRVEVDREAAGRVSPLVRIPERRQDLSRAVFERVERPLHRNARVEEVSIGQSGMGDDREHDNGDECEADCRMQGVCPAGGSDHLWRRCLARCEGGRQRIAAGQRRRDRKRGCRRARRSAASGSA